MIRGAGILFLTPDKQVLLLKRGPGGDHPGEWCFPGGTVEGGETPEDTAIRETIEEVGFLPDGNRTLWVETEIASVHFTTFLQSVKDKFMPKLNGEHTAFMWCGIEEALENDGVAY
jgi:8-oxo-dGTP pyrophosphatase MutT (NUDIX family)